MFQSLTDKINETFDKPKLADFYSVFSQLYMLLNSGSPLQEALLDIANDQPNQKLGAALRSISKSLASGIAAGAAFKQANIFPRLVPPTIEAGNRAGQLSETFLKLSELMWLQHNLYSKVKNALFVPKMAAVLMVIMTIAYIKIAIPEYIKLYEENDIELPWIVGAVTNSVNLIVDYWYITIFICFLGYKAWSWFTEAHTAVVDAWKLKVPIYSKLHFTFLQHQIASITALMLASGLTAPDALTQASKVADNSLAAYALTKAREDLQKGHPLSLSLKRNNGLGVFDGMLIASITAGEKSDQLVLALNQDCKYYERLINNMIDPVSTKITLLVMLPMGILIVCMFAFTLIPMFGYIDKVMAG